MTDIEKICDFQNLYRAHKVARCGKRNTKEVIEFELNLSQNLTELSDALKAQTYQLLGYYQFFVYEPKKRCINALHYRDRVIQHCLCDEILSPLIEKKLIYDNAACRIGKGTHFAIYRLTGFMQQYARKYGTEGYVLKCDIRKYFDNISHEVLKDKLNKIVKDKKVYQLLSMIIDSFEVTEGNGLPLGNQSSQWFALYYLDGLDRLIKERLRIRYYSRYMDDCILIHHDKAYLKYCLGCMRSYVNKVLQLEFNEKTQIFPLKNGVEYLGFHFYLSENGKVIRKLKTQAKKRYKSRLKKMKNDYRSGDMSFEEIKQALNSYHGHLKHGHTYHLQRSAMKHFVLCRT